MPVDSSYHISQHRSVEDIDLQIVKVADGDFLGMAAAADLDLARDFRFTNWSGLDLSGVDLGRTDFTGANLSGCRFDGARIADARFDKAIVDKMELMKAADWTAYLDAWKPPSWPVGDRHLRPGMLFLDNPWAPAMVVVPAGRFLMGSTEEETERFKFDKVHAAWERPRREITIAQPFALARDLVSRLEHNAMMDFGDDRETADLASMAVNNVSWNDCQRYLNTLEKRTGALLRLPSEAEWEYACRAGTTTAFWWGDEWNPEMANGDDSGATAIGTYLANPFGLRDMHGNFYEWCDDPFEGSLSDVPVDGSPDLPGAYGADAPRVLRGGSWGLNPKLLRSANREWGGPENRSHNIGFRPARTLITS